MDKLRELEIIKAALSNDISYQRKCIKQFKECGRETDLFEEWLKETEDLCRRVSKKILKVRAEEGAEN